MTTDNEDDSMFVT